MARYTGSVCRLCRREGTKLFLKGDRCYGPKCALANRQTIPGEHGQARQRKPSEYGLQLREKQKAKRAYGVMETQFHRYFETAERQKGITGENLLILLEPTVSLRDALFEITSAFATVGLSTGITAGLGTGAKLLSVLIMYIGRLGPLTVATLWYFSRGERVRFPQGDIAIG